MYSVIHSTYLSPWYTELATSLINNCMLKIGMARASENDGQGQVQGQGHLVCQRKGVTRSLYG